MKKLTLLIAMLIAIGGCTKEVPSDQLVERGGLVYEVNSQTPFTGSVLGYYENGQLKEKGNIKDGKLDGLVERYYENGQLKEKGNIKDGMRDGLYESYYENGQLKEKRNYKEDQLHGLWEYYYENGQPGIARLYKDGEEIPQ